MYTVNMLYMCLQELPISLSNPLV